MIRLERVLRRFFAISVTVCAASAFADDIVFERDIAPIFAKACAGCHSPKSETLKGKLDVTSVELLLKGGESGPAIVPGKPGESYLIALIEQTEEPVMPPKKNGNPLAPDQIALIRKWIEQGAKGDGSAIPVTGIPADTPPQDITPEAEASPSPASISAAAFSPVLGDSLLALGTLHDVILYRVMDGGKRVERKSVLAGHAEMVRTLAFSPDGALLAAAGGRPGRSGEIKVWNVSTGELVRTIEGHDDNILDIAFSPDGSRLASASYDKTIGVWEVASGAQVHALKHHVDAVYSVAFSPDGTRIASGAGDRTVKIWDAATGVMQMTLADSLDAVYAVAFSPNGKHLAAAGADKMIRVWYLGSSDVILQSSLSSGILAGSTFAHNAAILQLLYSPDGTKIFTTSEDKHIKIWNSDTLTEIAGMEEQSDWVPALAINGDGSLLAAGRYDSTSGLYTVEGGQLIAAREAGTDFHAPKTAMKEGKLAALDVGAVIVRATVPPSLQSLSPDRWHRGSEVEVTIEGKNLAEAVPLASHPGIVPTVVEVIEHPEPDLEELAKQPRGTGAAIIDNARPYTVKLKLAIAADTPTGRHEILFRTPIGVTNGAGITVILQPDTGETEPNNTAEEAAAIAWPKVIIGQINPSGDVDRFKLEAKAGDEVVLAVTDSGLNTSLRVFDADGGMIADSKTFGDLRNNKAAFRAEKDGVYVVELADNELRAGLGYRLHVGQFPVVTEYWPLGVRAGVKQTVQVKGFNLPSDTLEVEPAAELAYGASVGLPISGVPGSPVELPAIAVGPYEESLEQQDNNSPATAQAVGFPYTVNGVIESAGDADCYRFPATKGQTILIETMASRLGSPLDSFVEIVDSEGNPVQRAVARCVAETYLVLSNRDSKSGGLRMDSWSDFRINDEVMVGNEIIRLSRLPDYPDEDVGFATYPNGQRIGLYGTTPQHQAVNAKVYRVEIHPPEAQFAPNGKPVVPIYWRNDDGFFGEGDASGDSLLEFIAPEDGEYTVRLKDASEGGGPDYGYRLTLRAPAPDFEFFPGLFRINIAPGSRIPLDVRVRREEGFNEPVKISVHDLPEGISIESDTVLAGEERVKLAVVASPEAKSTPLDATFRVTAETTINGQSVMKESRIGAITVSAKQPDLIVNNGVPALTIKPGESGVIAVSLDRFNGFTSRSPIDVLNLPFGVRVLDTGLNGILVREGETERRMELYVEPWVKPMTRNIYIQSTIETPSSASPVFIGDAIALTITEAGDPKVAAN
ncbi:MAG: hypothetical protein AMXMBFR84_17420 [Candidatus Hydrogenedentota bacterium]